MNLTRYVVIYYRNDDTDRVKKGTVATRHWTWWGAADMAKKLNESSNYAKQELTYVAVKVA